jgi:Ca2+-binding RTX toxin-like protein
VLVQLSAPASGNVSVNYDFAGLSAYESIGASGDFSAVDGTLVFRAGETSKTLRVELNNQNSSTEPAIETVAITLSNAVGASIADANATLILADDDALSSSNLMAYGLSHDTYVVDGHNDRVLETTYGGRDQVNSLITYTLAANVENLLLQGNQGLAGTGNELANILTGNGGANTLTGLAGQDTLIGGAGNDKLVGGADRDVLTGGSGSDIFDFNALSESGLTTAARDVITDFTHGADRIDVSTLDARAATAGNEAFSFIGHASFGTNASGQLRFDYNATTHVATLYASTDADSAAEFSLQVTLANATALVASDFIL